jgi:two-component system, cell cycle response regulator DivK
MNAELPERGEPVMPGKTVLVVEDDDLNMKLVREVLRLGQYGILEATDAGSGIQMAREHRPDLILMDIHLPDMDGLSATRVINADQDLKDIPVVALTALAMKGDREKALEAGCAEYMTKPFRIQDLLEILDRYLKMGPSLCQG